MKKKENERLLKLAKSGTEGAVLVARMLLSQGEKKLFDFLRINGKPIRYEKTSSYLVKKSIPVNKTGLGIYLRYRRNNGKIANIYCGHCISVFSGKRNPSLEVINLAKRKR